MGVKVLRLHTVVVCGDFLENWVLHDEMPLEQRQGDGSPIAMANDGLALRRHDPRIPTPRPPTP